MLYYTIYLLCYKLYYTIYYTMIYTILYYITYNTVSYYAICSLCHTSAVYLEYIVIERVYIIEYRFVYITRQGLLYYSSYILSVCFYIHIYTYTLIHKHDKYLCRISHYIPHTILYTICLSYS